MKKMVVIVVWVILTALYCWNLGEEGRAIGAKANSAIENYLEMMVEYGGTDIDFEEIGSAGADMWMYRNFNNLSDEFKGNFTIIGVTTVMYVGASIGFYHVLTRGKKKNEK